MVKIITIQTKCPNCKEFKLIRNGFYYTITRPKKRQRYTCRGCGERYTVRSLFQRKYKHKRHDLNVLKAVESLMSKERQFHKKYDGKGNQNYSTRDISKIIKEKYRRKISKSSVAYFTKQLRERGYLTPSQALFLF